MFWNKSKSLTEEEISFRGRVAALMITLSSGDFVDNSSGKAVYWARSLAGITNNEKLTEAEKDLTKELAYLGMVGLADGAKKFFSDDNSVNLFVSSATLVLKNSWPNHSATKRYFSEDIKSGKMLYGGVIESFVEIYKNQSTFSLEELKHKADQFLSEEMISVSRETAKLILSMTDKDVQAIAKNLRG